MCFQTLHRLKPPRPAFSSVACVFLYYAARGNFITNKVWYMFDTKCFETQLLVQALGKNDCQADINLFYNII